MDVSNERSKLGDASSRSDLEIQSPASAITTNQQIPYAGSLAKLPQLKFVHFNDRKRKEHIDSPDEDSTEEPTAVKPLLKKARRDTVSKSSRHTASKDEDVRTFYVYLQVWSATTTTKPQRIGRPAKTTSVSKGPFKFDTSRSFIDFRCQVAAILSCREALLPVSEFGWKFDGEALAAPRKRIADYAGFKALMNAIKGKRTTELVVVWLHLPDPFKDQDIGRADYSSEDEATSAKVSTAKTSKAEERGTSVATLENRCPAGILSVSQGKLIWQSKTTRSRFEITPSYLKVRTNGIMTTLLFIVSAWLLLNLRQSHKKKPTSVSPALATNDRMGPSGLGQALVALTGQTANLQPIPGYPQPLAGYRYHPYHPPYYNPYIPPPAYVYSTYMSPHASGPAVPLPALSDTTGTTARNVSLDEFCSQYEISESDKAKLKKLGYEPGDRDVELLEEEH